MRTSLILTLMSILFVINGQTTAQSINSVSIIPSNPNTGDSIRVMAQKTFNSSPCNLQNSTVNINASKIEVTASHKAGMLPTICSTTDKIGIGKLNAGNYTLTYYIKLNNYPIILDSMTLSFKIQDTSQNPVIDSVKIIPPSPKDNDTIYAATFNTFPWSPCSLLTSTIDTNKNQIDLMTAHKKGSSQGPCNTSDTLKIGGFLTPGSYQLSYKIKDSSQQTTYDSLTTSFNVQFSQDPAIDSVKILPPSPTENDTVYAATFNTFPWSPCSLLTSTIDTNKNQIDLMTAHKKGSSQGPCNTNDTLKIGDFLTPGSYHLTYKIKDSSQQTTYDSLTTNFIVDVAPGKEDTRRNGNVIKLYPNPVDKKVFISLRDPSATIRQINIYSTHGQSIRSFTPQENEFTIDTGNMEEGIYFIEIIDDNDRHRIRKIITTNP